MSVAPCARLPRALGATLQPVSKVSLCMPPPARLQAVVGQHGSSMVGSSDKEQDERATQLAGKRPVLLFDVMDTIVYDPFFKEMPVFFQMSFQDLLKAKHPTAWIDFECGHIDEAELCRIFFADGRGVDQRELTSMLRSQYRFLDGMEDLLSRLNTAGYEMHALSNYPVWWAIIEEKLRLSRFMRWSFLSCTGPMQGVRKPAPEAYQRVINHLNMPLDQLLFIDDRKANIQGAEDTGLPAMLFTGSEQLEQDLAARGLTF